MAGIIQNATQEKALSPKAKLTGQIDAMKGEIAKALPSVITPERFTRMVLSAVSTTPQLANCTTQSFFAAMMNAAQLGLEPNTPLGQAYLIPFNNRKKGVLEVQFQLGYKGLLDLAYRSGEIEIIQAHIVYANDEFDYGYGLEPRLVHKPARGERGDAVYAYAMFKTKNGGLGYEVMSIADIRRHAERYSQAYKSGPWQTNFEEMAKKTVLKKVLKYAPLKSDFVRGMSQDETVKTAIAEDMYDIPAEEIEVPFSEVNEDTGEVGE